MKTSSLFVGVLLVFRLCAWPRVIAQDDNYCFFSGGYLSNSDEAVFSGDFHVVDFFVSPDQATNLFIGYAAVFTGQAGLHFAVDLSLTSDVADWWNQHINSSSTTFDHGAGTLYFAIQGTLTLHVVSSAIGENGAALVFNKVFLALGSAGLSDNWWFGIIGATQVGDGGNQITAMTVDGAYSVTFQRGDSNPTDTISLISF